LKLLLLDKCLPAAEAFAPATNLNEEEADDLPF
jgi:hypothetical protein